MPAIFIKARVRFYELYPEVSSTGFNSNVSLPCWLVLEVNKGVKNEWLFEATAKTITHSINSINIILNLIFSDLGSKNRTL